MCNKVSYGTKSEAKKHARQINYLAKHPEKTGGNKKDKTLKAYKCHICGTFHLTSLSTVAMKRLSKKMKRDN